MSGLKGGGGCFQEGNEIIVDVVKRETGGKASLRKRTRGLGFRVIRYANAVDLIFMDGILPGAVPGDSPSVPFR